LKKLVLFFRRFLSLILCSGVSLVYNLLHGIDIEATEAQIELYQTEHMQSIRERQSHIAEEERRIEMLIKHEQQAAALLAQELQEKDFLEKQKGQMLKKQTLEVMMGVRSISSSLFYFYLSLTFSLLKERDTISSDLIGHEANNKPPVSQFSRLMASAATGLDPINGSDLELQTAPSLLDLYRMQRAPPKVIKQERVELNQQNHTEITVQRHLAGGYSRELFFQKNWNETITELRHLVESQKSESLSQASSLWLHEWNECK
jgi:hypothetical protein